MNFFLRKLAIILAVITLGGCAQMDIQTYAAEKPALDLKQYFNGTLKGHGMFQGRSGEVKRRFTVTIVCTVVGDTITLDEDFVWSDGEKSKRVWTLKKQPDNTWLGTAADVVGAARGEVAGNALHWAYVLALPVDGTVYNVNFEDWMYLIDEKTMLNRAVMSKFGFKLGEVLISFTKQ